MKFFRARTCVAASLLPLAFIATRPLSAQGPKSDDVEPASAQVQGTATYRERIALPADAIFEATLEDVSRAGAQFELIARVRNEQPGNPPIPFVIAYDAGRINRSHSYVVRARILVGSQVWFTTDRNYPVLTAGRGDVVQLLLRRAPTFTNDARPPVTTTSALENTHWRLTRVGNTDVTAGSQQREAFFILNTANRTVTGSGGCNRITGSYELNGDRVLFNRIASTMMGCMSGMEIEQAFHKALTGARRWKITGNTLELFDSAGTRLARFEAA